MEMKFLEWVTKIEKIIMADFFTFPKFAQDKIKANYTAYCEQLGIKPNC